MNERRYYMAIGIFVISGFLALLFLAFRVSGGSSLYARDPHYQIMVEFNNIGRLKSQAKLALSGVTIGRVTDIHLDKDTFQAIVTLEVQKKYNHLPEDSVFSVVTAGLLGDNYVSVNPGFSQVYLKNNDYIDASQTTSALVLEELVSKLFSMFASQGPSQETSPSNHKEVES